MLLIICCELYPAKLNKTKKTKGPVIISRSSKEKTHLATEIEQNTENDNKSFLMSKEDILCSNYCFAYKRLAQRQKEFESENPQFFQQNEALLIKYFCAVYRKESNKSKA